MPAIVNVDRISKRYRVGGPRRAQMNLQESLAHGMRSIWRRLTRGLESTHDYWALRDVSFQVDRGEVLGVVGRNGAGKSTLLKILSRVTEPTSGRAELRGRLGSLLEVGTGFHPELTGRENIFLNGSLLGMSRSEIVRKFDDIVDFAEIGEFLDTPVKRFSSGMSVRLGFAIAAHLSPEIVLLDEVLAVGDASFQKKSLGKMRDVARDGRTVIFVSHDLAAVRRLCDRTILLSKGQVAAAGAPDDVIARYLSGDCNLLTPGKRFDLAQARRRGSGSIQFKAVLHHGDANESNVVANGSMNVSLWIDADAPREIDSLAVVLFDRSGVKLLNADTVLIQQTIPLRAGGNVVQLRIDRVPLNPGAYTLGLWLARRPAQVFDWIESAGEIEIHAPPNDHRPHPNEDGCVWTNFAVVDAA